MKNLSLKIKKDNENKWRSPTTMVRGGAPAPRSGDGWPPAKKSGRKTKRATVISRVGEKYTKRVYIPRKKETLTEYQSQYKAKQQIKYYYGGISETSLRRLVAKRTMPGGHPAICQLEKRLDVVLFRLGFASSILEARSLIKGGVVKLDQVAQNSSVGVVREAATPQVVGAIGPTGQNSREAKRVGLLSNTQVQVGCRITIDTTKAGWQTSYIAKIQHLRQNLFKLPTHLIVGASSSWGDKRNLSQSERQKGINPAPLPQRGPNMRDRGAQLEGYFVKEPVESETILPYKFPLNKFKYFLNSKK